MACDNLVLYYFHLAFTCMLCIIRSVAFRVKLTMLSLLLRGHDMFWLKSRAGFHCLCVLACCIVLLEIGLSQL